jgi:RNA polymerase sigma-70 factor (ECF subfamily)
MIELAAPPARAADGPAIHQDRLDHLISRIAAGDRAAFRRVYAFMAMRVWHSALDARLRPANAVAITRSTFVEVWHFAGAAARYDARDWIAALGTRRANDQLRTIDANARHGVAAARAAATVSGSSATPPSAIAPSARQT